MSANPTTPKKKLLPLLLGLLILISIVALSLPKSWFVIPQDKSKQETTKADGVVSLDTLREAAQTNPRDYNARTRYAMALMQDHKPDLAKEEFLAAVRLAPESAIAHHNIGVFYMNRGEQTKADESFQRELELAPGDGRAHYYRGATMQARKLYTDAKIQFDLATKLAPGLPDTYLALASMLMEKSPPEEIKGYTDNYLRYGGINKGMAYHLLSRAYRTKQNYPEAILYAEMATKEAPKQIIFWRNLGQAYSYSRRFDDADKTLRNVAGMLRDASPVYIEIGVNAEKAGRYPVAEEAFKKALELSPKTGNIHVYLSRLYLRMGNKDASLKEEQAYREWNKELVANKIQKDTAPPPAP